MNAIPLSSSTAQLREATSGEFRSISLLSLISIYCVTSREFSGRWLLAGIVRLCVCVCALPAQIDGAACLAIKHRLCVQHSRRNTFLVACRWEHTFHVFVQTSKPNQTESSVPVFNFCSDTFACFGENKLSDLLALGGLGTDKLLAAELMWTICCCWCSSADFNYFISSQVNVHEVQALARRYPWVFRRRK